MGNSMRGKLAGVLVLVSLIGLGGWTVTQASVSEASCPGRVICPITGQLICADKCPVRAVTTTPVKSLESKGICCNKPGK